MRARIAVLSLSVFLGAGMSSAQNVTPAAPPIPQVDYSTVNCAGFVTDQKVPDGIRLISAEQSNYKITFMRGDYVHINRGQDKGVRVGDRFSVVRPDKARGHITALSGSPGTTVQGSCSVRSLCASERQASGHVGRWKRLYAGVWQT